MVDINAATFTEVDTWEPITKPQLTACYQDPLIPDTFMETESAYISS